MRAFSLVAASTVLLLVGVSGAALQSAAAQSKLDAPVRNVDAAPTAATPQSRFNDEMKRFVDRLSVFTKDLELATNKAENISKKSRKDYQDQLGLFRGRIREFGQMLGEGSPLQQSIEGLDGWLSGTERAVEQFARSAPFGIRRQTSRAVPRNARKFDASSRAGSERLR